MGLHIPSATTSSAGDKPFDLSVHVREITTLLETTVSKKAQLRLDDDPGVRASTKVDARAERQLQTPKGVNYIAPFASGVVVVG
jgi:hypothetical protein